MDNDDDHNPLDKFLDDSVGYGKPPKHTQFKPGQSGNLKGRPSNKVLHLIIEDILNEMVTITTNGEKVKMTKKEVFLQQLMNDSMKGKSNATKCLIKLLKDLKHITPM